MPIAVIAFDFDPSAQLVGDLVVRWGAIALVAVIVAALVLAGRPGPRRRPAGGRRRLHRRRDRAGRGHRRPARVRARSTGRATAATPELLLDPSVGGLELGLAVVGGFITGRYVASLLGAPVGRWLHLAWLPALFVLGAGKLTMVLTGTGQGQPERRRLGDRLLGPGPWGSLAPALPSDPSQAYEGIATLAILTVLTVLVMVGAFRRRDGTSSSSPSGCGRSPGPPSRRPGAIRPRPAACNAGGADRARRSRRLRRRARRAAGPRPDGPRRIPTRTAPLGSRPRPRRGAGSGADAPRPGRSRLAGSGDPRPRF